MPGVTAPRISWGLSVMQAGTKTSVQATSLEPVPTRPMTSQVSITSIASTGRTKIRGTGFAPGSAGGTMPPSITQSEASMPLENGQRPLSR